MIISGRSAFGCGGLCTNVGEETLTLHVSGAQFSVLIPH